MKSIVFISVIVVFVMTYTAQVFAADGTPTPTVKDASEIENNTQKLREEQLKLSKELKVKPKTDKHTTNSSLKVQATKVRKTNLNKAKVIGVDDSSLTVEKEGISYTVLVGTFENYCTTKIRRKYFGETEITEINIGHTVNIFGRLKTNSQNTIEACFIRDLSIEKRHGVIIGLVTATNSSGWTMTTKRDPRGTQTVIVSEDTKYINRKQETILQSDINIGHTVRVKGVWDQTTSTLEDIVQVKDFSLPTKPKVAPTGSTDSEVTVTPSATSSATVTP